VVSESVRWHETQELPYLRGATYLAPARDSFKRFVLRDANYDPSQDMDYMSTQIASRIGPFGGSVIAEAYVNFGRLGVAAILMLFGGLIALLSRRSTESILRLGVCIVLAVGFQQLARNPFESA